MSGRLRLILRLGGVLRWQAHRLRIGLNDGLGRCVDRRLGLGRDRGVGAAINRMVMFRRLMEASAGIFAARRVGLIGRLTDRGALGGLVGVSRVTPSRGVAPARIG